jgi:TRAP transporter TAXI family solute receptor
VELAIGKSITVLEVDDAHAQALIQKYPFYTQFPIPAGSYQGQSAEVKTVAVKATFIVSSTLPDDTVYSLTKNLFESRQTISAAHVKGGELSAEYAVSGISVPFHPGAEKYFREIGALK